MEAPNSNYSRFFEKINKVDSVPVQNWDKNLLIGYFCKKYKEKYSENYKFKFNTEQPSKCFEVFVMNKMMITLSSNPEIMMHYIDFVFDTKIKNSKRKITSINTLDDQNCLYNFKNKYMNGIDIKIDRTKLLPQDIINQLSSINENIKTYGDLAFIIQSENEMSKQIKDQINFDFDILNKVV